MVHNPLPLFHLADLTQLSLVLTSLNSGYNNYYTFFTLCIRGLLNGPKLPSKRSDSRLARASWEIFTNFDPTDNISWDTPKTPEQPIRFLQVVIRSQNFQYLLLPSLTSIRLLTTSIVEHPATLCATLFLES